MRGCGTWELTFVNTCFPAGSMQTLGQREVRRPNRLSFPCFHIHTWKVSTAQSDELLP